MGRTVRISSGDWDRLSAHDRRFFGVFFFCLFVCGVVMCGRGETGGHSFETGSLLLFETRFAAQPSIVGSWKLVNIVMLCRSLRERSHAVEFESVHHKAYGS